LPKLLHRGVSILDGAAGQQPWFTRELEMYRKDGSTVWMETSMTIITDAAGEFNGLLGISRDISARRQAAKDIQQRAALLDSAYDSIIAYYLDGKIIYANQAACSMRLQRTRCGYKYAPAGSRR
jgi:PAS domain-containing protein